MRCPRCGGSALRDPEVVGDVWCVGCGPVVLAAPVETPVVPDSRVERVLAVSRRRLRRSDERLAEMRRREQATVQELAEAVGVDRGRVRAALRGFSSSEPLTEEGDVWTWGVRITG